MTNEQSLTIVSKSLDPEFDQFIKFSEAFQDGLNNERWPNLDMQPLDWHDAETTYQTAYIVTFLGKREYNDYGVCAYRDFEGWKAHVQKYSPGLRDHFGLEIGYVPSRMLSKD